MKIRFMLCLLSVLVFAGSFAGHVTAQDNTSSEERGGSGFRISPARDEMSIDPGKTIIRTILIRNVTSKESTARAVIDDFGPADDESGTPQLLIGEKAIDNYQYSIKPFVAQIPDLTLGPGEEKEVEAVFTVPESTAPGSYFGVVRFVTLNEIGEFTGQAGVGLNASVGTIFLVDVPGETYDLVSLEQSGVTKDGKFGRLFSSAPDTYVVRLKNEGNTFQAPFGTVKVKDWRGNVVQEFEFNGTDPRGNVLPSSIRRFDSELKDIGSVGRYKIESSISYGGGGNIINASVTFWVLPWKQIGLGLILLIALVVGGIKGIKSYNRRIISSSKESRVKKR